MVTSTRQLRLPHFIIAGAPRSATTWLWALADRHPAIAMARPDRPEPKFFNVDELYQRGMSYYSERWFQPLPPVAVYGEKSANYLESPHVPERIHRHLPDVKLVFMLRNPIDRAYSNYRWSRQNGVDDEPSFIRAIEREPERERTYPPALRFARPHSYVSRGMYADYLERFLAYFGRHQLLVLRTEDAVARPERVAERLHRFLGVDPNADVGEGLGVINAVVEPAPELDPAIRTALAERYRLPNQRLAALLGDDFEMWHN